MPAAPPVATLETAPPARGPLHLAIGMFDGVHLGHQAVIEAALHSARQDGGAAAVLTFNPHPSRLFRPDAPTLLLMPLAQKVEFLRALGVELVLAQPFTAGFARIAAEKFLPYLHRRLPALAAVYVGENFRFGRGRAGDTGTLVRAGRALGVAVVSVPRLRHNGRPISSTRLRALLAAGRVAEAARLLGYNYFCDGVITAGEGRGAQLGFPTLNIPWAPEARPAAGVYLVRLRAGARGPWRPGVANYGVRPTVTGGGPRVVPRLEVHLLDGAKPPRRGARVRVEWLDFLRSEKKFPSLAALAAQIARDKRVAEKSWKRKR